MSFTIPGFDHMAGAVRQREINRTRRAVQDWLAERPRTEFPAVELRFDNRIMPPHVVDAAFTRVRQVRHAAGSPRDFDWLAAMAQALPAAIESDRARIARLEPLAHLTTDGARKNGEAAKDGLPRELQAPLILEMPVMAF